MASWFLHLLLFLNDWRLSVDREGLHAILIEAIHWLSSSRIAVSKLVSEDFVPPTLGVVDGLARLDVDERSRLLAGSDGNLSQIDFLEFLQPLFTDVNDVLNLHLLLSL